MDSYDQFWKSTYISVGLNICRNEALDLLDSKGLFRLVEFSGLPVVPVVLVCQYLLLRWMMSSFSFVLLLVWFLVFILGPVITALLFVRRT